MKGKQNTREQSRRLLLCPCSKMFRKTHGYGYQSALVKRSTFSYVSNCYYVLISHLVTSDSIRGCGLWLRD